MMIDLAAQLVAATALLVFMGWQYFSLRDASARLAALRRNCFVTNEKGHRVRYSEASAAVRVRAEK